VLLALTLGLLSSCSSDKEFEKTPVDHLVVNMSDIPNYTIILDDMKEEGGKFYHKYKIVTPAKLAKAPSPTPPPPAAKKSQAGIMVFNAPFQMPAVAQADSATSAAGAAIATNLDAPIPNAYETEWTPVSEYFFEEHVNDLGMEIATKNDGKLTKQVAPPGYSQYVGNQKYGNWKQNSDGTSFWEFYGKYALISSMFGLMHGPIYRRGYMDYRGNYSGRRPYYGSTTGGTRQYGTFSRHTQASRPSSYSRLSSSNSFKSRVNNRVSRSSSRYGSGSSSRSRSSGFGGGK
jgi:hypothetical protein